MFMKHKQSSTSYIKLRNKDYYSLLYEISSKYSVGSVLDVGCASGDFIYQGSERISWTGMAVSDELLSMARKTRSRKNIEYIQGDILDKHLCIDVNGDFMTYDAVSLLGTLSTIGDGEKAICQCLDRSKRLFAFQGALNPYAFDVLVGHRRADIEEGEYMFSHNMLSIHTMRKVLGNKGFEIIHEEEYMPKERLICEAGSDSVRSFEIALGTKRALSNHLNIISSEFVVVAKRSEEFQGAR